MLFLEKYELKDNSIVLEARDIINNVFYDNTNSSNTNSRPAYSEKDFVLFLSKSLERKSNNDEYEPVNDYKHFYN